MFIFQGTVAFLETTPTIGCTIWTHLFTNTNSILFLKINKSCRLRHTTDGLFLSNWIWTEIFWKIILWKHIQDIRFSMGQTQFE